MRSVTVVGGGISGLATAYYLSLAGIPVEIVERSDRLGGLIATHRTPHGPVETAAIAMKNGARVDAVCRDLGVPMLSSSARRPGYIYRDGPRRWPLGVGETLSLAARYAVSSVSGQRRPRPLETVDAWSARVLGRAAAPWLVGPFLQGRYAGDPVRLSASLLFGPKEPPVPGPAGIVSPVQGMQQLIDAFACRLRKKGVAIRLDTSATVNGSAPVVICTAACDAAAILRDVAPGVSQKLATIDMLPLIRITAFYPGEQAPLAGRGVLFPRTSGVRALGAVFNANIFPDREGQYSESWIYGGASDRAAMDLSDDELEAAMDRDRERLCGRAAPPAARFVYRWRAGLPYYDVQLESVLAQGLDLPKGVFLVGNYVGGIGVPMLLEQAATVADRVRELS